MTANSDAKRFSILIVDDEPKNIQLLGSILKGNDYDVEFATDGGKDLEWMDHNNFDLVLLDIMMPGLSGYEVCERIRVDRRKSHISVIFLAAKTDGYRRYRILLAEFRQTGSIIPPVAGTLERDWECSIYYLLQTIKAFFNINLEKNLFSLNIIYTEGEFGILRPAQLFSLLYNIRPVPAWDGR